MKKTLNILIAIASVVVLFDMLGFSQETGDQEAIISVERIWDRALHNAFTDLVFFQGRFYCCFREGTQHVHGVNGSVRIIASPDGQNWYSVAQLIEAEVDLRDPKLSVTPDGRLMVVMGGSFYKNRELVKREPRVAFSDRRGASFTPPQPIIITEAIRTDNDWLWRITWHKKKGYGVVYQAQALEFTAHLVETEDGLRFRHVNTFVLPGNPNETTLRFLKDGHMVALVRREGGDQQGMIGSSPPPYSSWNWRKLPARLGGPNLVVLPDDSLLCGTRQYLPGNETRTQLALVTLDGGFTPVLILPSGGDTGYPGLVVQDGILYISYYSSQEGRSMIYLARIWPERLGPRPDR
jgi:hypothetical protein